MQTIPQDNDNTTNEDWTVTISAQDDGYYAVDAEQLTPYPDSMDEAFGGLR